MHPCFLEVTLPEIGINPPRGTMMRPKVLVRFRLLQFVNVFRCIIVVAPLVLNIFTKHFSNFKTLSHFFQSFSWREKTQKRQHNKGHQVIKVTTGIFTAPSVRFPVPLFHSKQPASAKWAAAPLCPGFCKEAGDPMAGVKLLSWW